MGFRLGSTGVTIIFWLCKLRPEYTLKSRSTEYMDFDYTLDIIYLILKLILK